MRIVGFGAENMASTHLRVRSWIQAMKERGHEGFFYADGFDDVAAFDAKVNGADVVVYGRTHNARHVAMLHAGRKLYDYKLIVDTDDLVTDIPAYNFASAQYHAATGVTRIAEAQYRESDAITVTTEFLRDATAGYNAATYLIPNCCDTELWSPVRHRDKELRHRGDLRIYWGGGGGHWDDLVLVKPAFQRIYDEYPHTKFIFSNFVPDWMAGLDASRIFFLPLVPYGSFPRVLTWLCIDVALAPLVQNNFNRAKSHVKYLDYGMAGIAGIYQDIDAYESVVHGITGLKATDADDWYEKMKLLVETPTLRERIGDQARRSVLAQWTVDSWAARYEAMLKQICGVVNERVAQPLVEGVPLEATCQTF